MKMKRWTPPRIGGTELAALPDNMNKSVLLLAVGSAFVIGLPLAASAYDDDPGYGPYRPWYGGEDRTWRSGGHGGNDLGDLPRNARKLSDGERRSRVQPVDAVQLVYQSAERKQQSICLDQVLARRFSVA